MLEGVVPFPPEYAARYRARGYWADRALRDEFSTVFQRYAERVALVDGERTFTYGEVDRLSTNLALNLLDIGLVPLDRVILALPNVAEFVILYFALQKIGAIPIAALVTHRFAEISQFAHLSGATAVATPDRTRDFDFSAMVQRVQAEAPALKHAIVLGFGDRGLALERIDRRPRLDDAIAVALLHGVHVVVGAWRRVHGRLEIERDEHRLDARCREIRDDVRFFFRHPAAAPILRKRIDVRLLARNPLRRIRIAMEIDDPHALASLSERSHRRPHGHPERSAAGA